MASFLKAGDAAEIAALLVPVLALAVNVLTQIAAVRLRRGTQFFRSIVEGFAAGLLAAAALEFAIWSTLPDDNFFDSLIVNLITYPALSYCYFAVANLGHTSIRIRLYSEIADSPEGKTVEEVNRIYNEDALMQMRLLRLVESGDLVFDGVRYGVGRKRLVYIANTIFAAKHILLGKGSEFE